MARSRTNSRNYGCSFFLTTCIVSCILLIANQSVIAGAFHLTATAWPPLSSQGARQFAIFVGPVLLLFGEWWLIDTIYWWNQKDE